MKEINYRDAMKQLAEHLDHGGVFLTIGGEKPNTMTIGWASIGSMWNMPVLTVLVRPQRHSYEMIKRAGEFTVSVPIENPMREQLAFAGTQSGRDVDKFDAHGMTAIPAREVGAPIIKECTLHFECRTVLTQDITGDRMDAELQRDKYPERDFHTMFFGRILRCYLTGEA